jgi:hypothetical protein
VKYCCNISNETKHKNIQTEQEIVIFVILFFLNAVTALLTGINVSCGETGLTLPLQVAPKGND